MVVRKFGGTSVGSPEGMIKVLNLIKAKKDKQFVVLSALSGVTNLLEKYCNSINDAVEIRESIMSEVLLRHISHMDALKIKDASTVRRAIITYLEKIKCLSENIHLNRKEIIIAGELMSVAIFSSLLKENGLLHVVIDEKFYITIDDNNIPNTEQDHKLIDLIETNDLVIAPGFVCKNVSGGITNLGRGGSDYSASLYASRVKASLIEIWSDVDGFCQNDPRFVGSVQVLKSLSYDEASELAYFGAKLLHPLCVKPARIKSIPILLKNTNNPIAKGTWISSESSRREITAIAAKDGLVAIKITSDKMMNTHGYLKDLFSIFDVHQISVDTVATSEVSVSMTVDNVHNLQSLLDDLTQIGQVEIQNGLSNICIVGDFKRTKKGIAALISDTLQDVPIYMISYGGNEYSISFLIESSHKVLALNNLQSIFNKELICA